jgi:hypothetical protein
MPDFVPVGSVVEIKFRDRFPFPFGKGLGVR